jgi:hypothetical protein
MKSYTETLAGQAHWASRNLVHNLDFIPDDKLDWKPAPTALSALEIVSHLLGALGHLGRHFRPDADSFQEPSRDSYIVTTREEAKERLLAAVDEFCDNLKSASPELLAKSVELPFGKFPMSFLAGMPVIDLIHHHGQITYIQSLLGDEESHFDFSLLPKP